MPFVTLITCLIHALNLLSAAIVSELLLLFAIGAVGLRIALRLAALTTLLLWTMLTIRRWRTFLIGWANLRGDRWVQHWSVWSDHRLRRTNGFIRGSGDRFILMMLNHGTRPLADATKLIVFPVLID